MKKENYGIPSMMLCVGLYLIGLYSALNTIWPIVGATVLVFALQFDNRVKKTAIQSLGIAVIFTVICVVINVLIDFKGLIEVYSGYDADNTYAKITTTLNYVTSIGTYVVYGILLIFTAMGNDIFSGKSQMVVDGVIAPKPVQPTVYSAGQQAYQQPQQMNNQKQNNQPRNSQQGTNPQMRQMNAQSINGQPMNSQSIRSMNGQEGNRQQMHSVNGQTMEREQMHTQSSNSQSMNREPLHTQSVNNQPMNAQSMNRQPMNPQSVNGQPMNNQPMNGQPMRSMNNQQMHQMGGQMNAQSLYGAKPQQQNNQGMPQQFNNGQFNGNTNQQNEMK